MPTLLDIETAIHMLKKGKAPGEDGLISDLFRHTPAQAAQVLYPLYVKQWMRGQTPLRHKGDITIPLSMCCHICRGLQVQRRKPDDVFCE